MQKEKPSDPLGRQKNETVCTCAATARQAVPLLRRSHLNAKVLSAPRMVPGQPPIPLIGDGHLVDPGVLRQGERARPASQPALSDHLLALPDRVGQPISADATVVEDGSLGPRIDPHRVQAGDGLPVAQGSANRPRTGDLTLRRGGAPNNHVKRREVLAADPGQEAKTRRSGCHQRNSGSCDQGTPHAISPLTRYDGSVRSWVSTRPERLGHVERLQKPPARFDTDAGIRLVRYGRWLPPQGRWHTREADRRTDRAGVVAHPVPSLQPLPLLKALTARKQSQLQHSTAGGGCHHA